MLCATDGVEHVFCVRFEIYVTVHGLRGALNATKAAYVFGVFVKRTQNTRQEILIG